MASKTAALEAATKAGRRAYHDFAHWSSDCAVYGVYGCDAQAYAAEQFADHTADYSARLAAYVEPAFRAGFESEAGKYVDEMDITLAPLTAAAAPIAVTVAHSPIAGVVQKRARHILCDQLGRA